MIHPDTEHPEDLAIRAAAEALADQVIDFPVDARTLAAVIATEIARQRTKHFDVLNAWANYRAAMRAAKEANP